MGNAKLHVWFEAVWGKGPANTLGPHHSFHWVKNACISFALT